MTESIPQPFDSKSPTVFANKGEAILALDATDVLDGLAQLGIDVCGTLTTNRTDPQ